MLSVFAGIVCFVLGSLFMCGAGVNVGAGRFNESEARVALSIGAICMGVGVALLLHY